LNAANSGPRGKVIAINAYAKERRSQINYQTLNLKKLKKEQTRCKPNRNED